MDGQTILWCCNWLLASPRKYSVVTFPKELSYCHPGGGIPYSLGRRVELIDGRKFGENLVQMTETLIDDCLLRLVKREDYQTIWSKAFRKSVPELDGILFGEYQIQFIDFQFKTETIIKSEQEQDKLRKMIIPPFSNVKIAEKPEFQIPSFF